MSGKPNTISDDEWRRMQKAAARETGGLVKNDDQKAKASTWTRTRDQARKN